MTERTMQFNNKRWREMTREAIKKLEPQWGTMEVISPFGFEVTQNKQHLKKILRRFYCYLGLNSLQFAQQNEIAANYVAALLDVLKVKDERFYKDIVIVIKNKEFEFFHEKSYQCNPFDKLVDVQTRHTKDIVGEYADYIIASLSALFELKGDCTEFMTHAVKRSRTFQLYIMFEKIFAHLMAPISTDENKLMDELHHYLNNSVQIIYTAELMHVEASAIEKSIYYELVRPRVGQMIQFINQTNDQVTIEINDFHNYLPLKLKLDKPIYEDTKSFIKKTYEEFV